MRQEVRALVMLDQQLQVFAKRKPGIERALAGKLSLSGKKTERV